MIFVEQLTRNNIISIVGAIANDYGGQRCIVPQFTRGMSNLVTSSGSGDYDGGDRVIGFLAYEVHGDLLITAGWGDGAAIRRLNNDGTMTKIWHDNNALYRDTTSTYNHINSLAIHKGSSQIALTTHNVNGYSMIDYSNVTAGGTTVVNNRPSSKDIFSNGATIDRSGHYYENGMVTAGDWLYLLDYSASHYKKFPRRHWTNGTEQLLDATADKYSGSATMDRNGYRGQLFYDEVNDRVYYNFHYNGNFVVILDASTANPKVLWCDLGDAGQGDDGYETGLYIEDPVNSPNDVWIGGSSRVIHCDYTPCFSGSAPTILDQVWVESEGTVPTRFSSYFRMGTKSTSITNSEFRDRFDYIPIHADRGRAMLGGWIDEDNNNAVALYRHDNTTEDTSSNGRGRSVRCDYSHPVFRMRSANGTPYLIQLGYGYDGHGFRIWNDSVGTGLVGNWSVEYGTYTTGADNIDFVSLRTDNHFVPGGTSLTIYVSNNNGSTWEQYSEGSSGVHMFNSSGTQLRVKYVATGMPTKAPYKLSSVYDTVTYGTLYEAVKNPAVKMKVTRKRLTGRK